MSGKPLYSAPYERIFTNTLVTPEGCWIWLGARQPNGYGRVSVWCPVRKRTVKLLAHRWVYEQLVGPIPEGAELDHDCNVRECVAPEHLRPVTHQENQIARVARAARRKAQEGGNDERGPGADPDRSGAARAVARGAGSELCQCGAHAPAAARNLL